MNVDRDGGRRDPGDGGGRRFAGASVLVTGGGSGIGAATARAFAAEGASVVVAGRDGGRLARTVELIVAAGGAASAVRADVTSARDTAAMVAAAVDRHGRLDVACNAAGIFVPPAPVVDLDEDDFDRVLDVNLKGVWLSLRAQMRQMRAQGGGAIVNVASNIGAHVRRPGLSAYVASKAGVSALTRVAALEGIGDGVRVNCVSPGATDTSMSLRPGETDEDRAVRLADAVPLGRVGTRDEVAAAVLWLASADGAFAVGHDLVVDGGVSA